MVSAAPGQGHPPLARALALAGFLALATLAPASLSVVVTTRESVVAQGEAFEVVVSTISTDGDQPVQPDPIDFAPFEVVSVASESSTQLSIINGRRESKVVLELRYLLRAPAQPGSYELPVVTATSGGRTARSARVRLEVEPLPDIKNSLARTLPAPFTNPPRRPIDRAVRGHLFIRPEIDRTSCRIREEVRVTWSLYFTAEIAQAIPGFASSLRGAEISPRLEEASYPDFFVQLEHDITRSPQQQRTEVVDGTEFFVWPLRTLRLFPQKRGALSIPGYALILPLQDRSRRGSIFAFNETVFLSVPAAPIPLSVEALPDAGRPATFAGAVGDVTLAASLDRTEARQGDDLLTVTVVATGTGFLPAFPRPRLTAPADDAFSVFDVQEDDADMKIDGPGAPLRGRRVWRFILRPERPGAQEIAPFALDLFDPAAGTYRTVATKPLAVTVTPNAALEGARANGAAGAAAPEPDAALGHDLGAVDLAFVDTRPWGEVAPRPAPTPAARRLRDALPLAGLAGFLVALGWPARRRGETPARRLARAHRAALDTLADLERRADLAPRDFGAALASALRAYLAARFDRSPEGLTAFAARDLLLARGAAPELADRWAHLLEAADAFRYAATEEGEREALVALARTLVAAAEEVPAA